MPSWHHGEAVVVVLAVVVCQWRRGGGVVSSCQAQVGFLWHRGVGTTGGARRGREGVGGREGHRVAALALALSSWRRWWWHCRARPGVPSRHRSIIVVVMAVVVASSCQGACHSLGVVLPMPSRRHSRAVVIVVAVMWYCCARPRVPSWRHRRLWCCRCHCGVTAGLLLLLSWRWRWHCRARPRVPLRRCGVIVIIVAVVVVCQCRRGGSVVHHRGGGGSGGIVGVSPT